ncbi:MAG: D-Ala-D-Ala carboxypeptidase family metallohydrolase [Verrucomicrobiaceae bacterium]
MPETPGEPNNQPSFNRRTFLVRATALSALGTAWAYRADLSRHGASLVRHLPASAPSHPPASQAPKPKPIPLPGEKNYAAFLASLNLRFIAPHEIIAAHRRQRNGISNQLPPRELWHRIVPALHIADQLRHRLGHRLSHITSAYRHPHYNAQCPGAASRSQHTQNRALDLVYDCDPQVAMTEALAMRREGRFKGGLGLYSSFIHLDTRGRNATW